MSPQTNEVLSTTYVHREETQTTTMLLPQDENSVLHNDDNPRASSGVQIGTNTSFLAITPTHTHELPPDMPTYHTQQSLKQNMAPTKNNQLFTHKRNSKDNDRSFSIMTLSVLILSIIVLFPATKENQVNLGALSSLAKNLLPTNYESIEDPQSVYVPGAGFSGFWFTLGRLQSLTNPRDHNYYCYSAGCLGAVAILRNKTMEDMATMALTAQRRWRYKEISRYEIVQDFVNRLIPPDEIWDDEQALDLVNVITTTKGIGRNIRKAKSAAEMREMLVQTTWIPFATGWGFWKMDENGEQHMDGGASRYSHPICNYNLDLPMKFDLMANVINPNLGMDKVEKLWNEGLSYGIN